MVTLRVATLKIPGLVFKHITINIWYINSTSPRLLREPEPARCLHRAEPGSHNFHWRFRNFYWSALYGDMLIGNCRIGKWNHALPRPGSWKINPPSAIHRPLGAWASSALPMRLTDSLRTSFLSKKFRHWSWFLRCLAVWVPSFHLPGVIWVLFLHQRNLHNLSGFSNSKLVKSESFSRIQVLYKYMLSYREISR